MDHIQIEALAMEMDTIIKTTNDLSRLLFFLEDMVLQTSCRVEVGNCTPVVKSENKIHLGYKILTEKSHFPLKNLIAAYNLTTREKLNYRSDNKHKMVITDKENQILVLFAKGHLPNEMTAVFREIYRSKTFSMPISEVTDAVKNRVAKWHNRSFNSLYYIVYFDFIHTQISIDNYIVDKLVFFALGINIKGHKELLGIWLAKKEHDTSFWLTILTELKNRGLNDIHIACVDPIEGVSGVMNRVYPRTRIQLRGRK